MELYMRFPFCFLACTASLYKLQFDANIEALENNNEDIELAVE